MMIMLRIQAAMFGLLHPLVTPRLLAALQEVKALAEDDDSLSYLRDAIVETVDEACGPLLWREDADERT